MSTAWDRENLLNGDNLQKGVVAFSMRQQFKSKQVGKIRHKEIDEMCVWVGKRVCLFQIKQGSRIWSTSKLIHMYEKYESSTETHMCVCKHISYLGIVAR